MFFYVYCFLTEFVTYFLDSEESPSVGTPLFLEDVTFTVAKDKKIKTAGKSLKKTSRSVSSLR